MTNIHFPQLTNSLRIRPHDFNLSTRLPFAEPATQESRPEERLSLIRQEEFPVSRSQAALVTLGQVFLDPRLYLRQHPRDPVLAQPLCTQHTMPRWQLLQNGSL